MRTEWKILLILLFPLLAGLVISLIVGVTSSVVPKTAHTVPDDVQPSARPNPDADPSKTPTIPQTASDDHPAKVGAGEKLIPETTTADADEQSKDKPSQDKKSEPRAADVAAVSTVQTETTVVPIAGSGSNSQVSSAVGVTTVVKGSESEGGAKAAGPHERFLVLTPGGPVVIDLVIMLQGAGYESALARLVDEALKVADEDGDGKATWKSAVENPKFRSGQFGNLVADTDEEREQLVRLYDSDRDGLVDREELPRFLTRNSGGGRSFSLRSSNEYRSSNRARSPTRLLLDADRDGVRDGAITTEQMDAAPATLLNRDADDDEVVVLAELKDSIDNMAAPATMISNRRRTNEPDTAVWLTNPSVDLSKRWGMVQFLLQELYSYGEKIRLADWPLTPELFRHVDADSDGTLVRTELAKLLDVPAHLVIEVMFDGATEQDRGPRIKLRQLSSELAALKPSVRELPTRLSLQLPDVELEFFVNEDPSLSNAAQAAKTQFMALDRDKNGYLEKSEVPEQLPGMDATFESFDANGDGKVYEPEVVAYLEQRGAVARSQVRARVADQEDALFTALDTDGDGRLNSREIRETPARLRAIDRNGDGILQSHEIPGSMVVGFVRGNSQQDAQFFSGPAPAPMPQDATIPRWFRGMDANSDGEISRREFFGDQDQFNQIDVNHDGFILQAEAAMQK